MSYLHQFIIPGRRPDDTSYHPEKHKPLSGDMVVGSDKQLEALASLGGFAWRRGGSDDIEPDLYEHDNEDEMTIMTYNNFKQNYGYYWDDWKPLVGKTIYYGYGKVILDRKGDLIVKVPGLVTPEKADNWFARSFGITVMNDPKQASFRIMKKKLKKIEK